jgi:glucans biosynthesis protein
LLHTGAGEWIWRPLTNPAQIRTSAFADKSPRGFGLLQRDRSFEHYDDPVANYHLRPSAWVEPVGDWGEGSVRLVELPTPDETNDNIVAFWVPAQPPVPGQELNFNYRLEWSGENGSRPPRGYVVATRSGAVLDYPDRRRFVLDFARLDFAGDPAKLEAVVTVAAGATVVAEPYVSRVGPTGLWRVAFELAPDGSHRPVELRCFLRHEQNVLTETWSHLWNP